MTPAQSQQARFLYMCAWTHSHSQPQQRRAQATGERCGEMMWHKSEKQASSLISGSILNRLSQLLWSCVAPQTQPIGETVLASPFSISSLAQMPPSSLKKQTFAPKLLCYIETIQIRPHKIKVLKKGFIIKSLFFYLLR